MIRIHLELNAIMNKGYRCRICAEYAMYRFYILIFWSFLYIFCELVGLIVLTSIPGKKPNREGEGKEGFVGLHSNQNKKTAKYDAF